MVQGTPYLSDGSPPNSERKIVILNWSQLVQRGHGSAIRALSHNARQLLEVFQIARRRKLNASVGTIHNPAREPKSPRVNSNEPPETNSLHAAAYPETNRRHGTTPCSAAGIRTQPRSPLPEAFL
jgi:hypothetical protein